MVPVAFQDNCVAITFDDTVLTFEATVDMSTSHYKTLRPLNTMVYSWNGATECIDVVCLYITLSELRLGKLAQNGNTDSAIAVGTLSDSGVLSHLLASTKLWQPP